METAIAMIPEKQLIALAREFESTPEEACKDVKAGKRDLLNKLGKLSKEDPENLASEL